jgi:hypothetical protein
LRGPGVKIALLAEVAQAEDAKRETMMRHLRPTVAVALMLATPIAAQEGPPVGPAQLELGRRLAEAGDFNAFICAMGAAEIERMAADTDLDEAGRARLRETGMQVLASARATLMERIAPIYADAYPPDQLEAIVTFLESPAGRAYTGGFTRLVPRLAQVLQGYDLGREVRAAFCRETRQLCETEE